MADPDTVFDPRGRRIWVAGHTGMVGSAVVRRLAQEDCEVLTVGRDRVDLRDAAATLDWLRENRPDAVVMAAATVGGIKANDSYPATFLHDNLAIANSTIDGAYRAGVKRFVFLGSSCIYPKLAPQPMQVDSLLTGPLEPTNEWYAVAKIAGLKMCQAYRRQHGVDYVTAMPCNLYGPHDNFDLEGSHVIPALMRRFAEAKAAGANEVAVWGSGTPLREFLHVDDAADACVTVLRAFSGEPAINIGDGREVSIADLAKRIAEVVGLPGTLRFDPSKPDGAPRKVLDSAEIRRLGWAPSIDLDAGLRQMYQWYQKQRDADPAARPD
ncbi:GDP-L-fucose synthase [Thalassobaculum sp.]|uniref:GDP-L-fucose synthase family protein n=1 Tax=Thalassobaculum sp. TaxID=2022740 RepID=UPI0032F02F58